VAFGAIGRGRSSGLDGAAAIAIAIAAGKLSTREEQQIVTCSDAITD